MNPHSPSRMLAMATRKVGPAVAAAGAGLEVVDDAVGAGGLGGALVQREERGFGYAVEMAGVDDWHGATVRPPIGWLSKPVAKITRRAVPR